MPSYLPPTNKPSSRACAKSSLAIQKLSHNRNLDKPTKLRYTQTGIRDMGGPPPSSTGRKAGILELEAAMDFYEILMLALAAAQLVIQIAQLLFHRRKSSE